MKIHHAFFVVLISLVVLSIGVVGLTKKSSGKCIQVFYDRKDATVYLMRSLRMYSDYRVVSSRIADYQTGDFGKCQASFVVSVEHEHKIPKMLLDELPKSEKNISWVGLNIWQLGDHLEKRLGVRYIGQNLKRSSLKDLFYHGHVYREGSVGGNMSQVDFLPVNSDKVEVLIEARFVGSRELRPYLVRSKNIYYLADVSFGPAFLTFLTDMVGTPPTHVVAQLVGGI